MPSYKLTKLGMGFQRILLKNGRINYMGMTGFSIIKNFLNTVLAVVYASYPN